MNGYYNDKLAADKLRRCYEIAPLRVQQYLQAEIDYILQQLGVDDTVLELGCGYGRVLKQLSQKARQVVGIDTSLTSLQLARQTLADMPHTHLLAMDAARLGFADAVFDCVVCIQNGIAVFGVSQRELLRQSLRVTRAGGMVLFSSYSPRFWQPRLDWFRLQSEAGLVGIIDEEKTGDGIIVCRDGFTATTVSGQQFQSLTDDLPAQVTISEVDKSSLFCRLIRS